MLFQTIDFIDLKTNALIPGVKMAIVSEDKNTTDNANIRMAKIDQKLLEEVYYQWLESLQLPLIDMQRTQSELMDTVKQYPKSDLQNILISFLPNLHQYKKIYIENTIFEKEVFGDKALTLSRRYSSPENVISSTQTDEK